MNFVAYPDGTHDSTHYDRNGNRTLVTARNKVTTSYVYDSLNRLLETHDGNFGARLNTTTYDAIGQVLTSKDGDNNVTTYAYDDAGRRTSVTDALNHVTTFGYDAAGNQTSVKERE